MKKLMLGASFLVSILSNPAHAGFQFNAPDKAEAKPVISDGGLLPMEPFMPAVPSQTVNEQAVPAQAPTTPVATSQPMMTQPPAMAPQPNTPVAPIALPEPTAPTTQMSTPMMDRAATQSPVATTPTIENISPVASLDQPAVGFAKDLPLSIALNQVIPQGYTYVTDPDLDKSSLVSWTGGQAWPMVLRDMVTPLGYDAIISGTSVRIIKRPAPALTNEIASTPPTELIKPIQPQAEAEPTVVETTPSPQTQIPDIDMAPVETTSNTQESNTLPIDIIESASEPTDENLTQDSSLSPAPEQQNAWIAQNGVSLKTVIESWSEIEGVDLFWSTDYDYTLKSDVKIHGSYQEAIETLLSGFSSAKPKPYGKLHPNLPDGPAVLVIETREMPKA